MVARPERVGNESHTFAVSTCHRRPLPVRAGRGLVINTIRRYPLWFRSAILFNLFVHRGFVGKQRELFICRFLLVECSDEQLRGVVES